MQGNTRYRSYRSGSWKLVESSRGEAFLYDLATDSGETSNLAAAQPEQLARLRAQLEAERTRLGLPALDASLEVGAAAQELDQATRERLRQLGYVE